LPKYDSYVEVKGYKTERDEAKWKQFPKKLLIIDKKDIDNIKKGIYNLIVVK
jgi:wobble nucleotide-excising tRNase